MATTYRGRFAPSPTGRLHLGLARTALLGWLRARSRGGAFIVRMEDIDRPRVVPGAAQALLDDLAWLGLDWDEGPDRGGPFGPYVQSQRLEHYEDALAQLAAAGAVYPCTCSRKEIASAASAPHGPSEWGHTYPGTCRDGPSHPERTPALRLRVPDVPPTFDDGLRSSGSCAQGDFVVRRADGLHSYQLACVVDDIAMQISEVLRGDDLYGVTPWQLALYDALGARRPAFAHVPLLMGPDGARLAKRHGAVAVADYRDGGWSAPQLLGWLAFSCGLRPSPAKVAADQLVADFDLTQVREAGAPLPAPVLPD